MRRKRRVFRGNTTLRCSLEERGWPAITPAAFTIDNLYSSDVPTRQGLADGRLVHASENEHPDHHPTSVLTSPDS
ncbi:hypothetical protein C8039_06680 [Halogeometricum sp. wsp3]|nr:hypothetical protein C8039_06680 [Halogeometricum sp. wsp3]